MKGIYFFVHSLLPKRVSMDLTIGVRFIEGGKSKRAVIISEIRERNAYLSGMTKFRTNRRLRRGWCHRIQDGRSYAGDRTRDKSSGEAADVEESSTSLG